MMEFDASGLRTLGTEFNQLSKKAAQLAKVVVKKTAKDIEASVKAVAPRDPARPPKDPSRPVTGFLRNSIKTSDLRGVSQSSPEAEVRASAEYAPFQEFGTSTGVPKRPFLNPAANKHEPAFLAAMEQILNL